MSTLSKEDAIGCRKLLNLLSEYDLLALNDTVTNKMIAVGNTKGEAKLFIVSYLSVSLCCRLPAFFYSVRSI